MAKTLEIIRKNSDAELADAVNERLKNLTPSKVRIINVEAGGSTSWAWIEIDTSS